MKDFTIKLANYTSCAQPYLTAKDKKSPRELVAELTKARGDDEIIELAKKIANIAEHNKRIDRHEKQMETIRPILNNLEKGEAFRLWDLASAIVDSKETRQICERDERGLITPLGAIRTVIAEMIKEGTLEKKFAYIEHNCRKVWVYIKK
jgi:hypothetical protein